MGRVSVDVFSGQEGIGALARDWDDLCSQPGSEEYYQTWPWYQAYLTALAPASQEMLFFRVMREGHAIGIFPMVRFPVTLGGFRFRALGFPQHDYLGTAGAPLPKPHAVAAMEALVDFLETGRAGEWDMVLFASVAETSDLGPAMDACRKNRSARLHQRYSRYLECGGADGQVPRGMSSSFRRNLRRLSRRGAQLGTLSLEVVSERHLLPSAFQEFAELESSGWKGADGTATAVNCNSNVRHYYEVLLDEFGRRSMASINLLKCGRDYIAGQVCLGADGALHILKIGYRESYAAIAPGFLLLERVLEHYGADGVVRRVGLETNPPWATLWGAHQIAHYDCYIFRNSGRGILASTLVRARGLGKRVLRFWHSHVSDWRQRWPALRSRDQK